MAWLDKIDPNVVLGLVTAAVGWIANKGWRKADNTNKTVRAIALQAWDEAITVLPSATIQRLRADARDLALLQLRKLGLKTTPALSRTVEDLLLAAGEHLERQRAIAGVTGPQ